MLPEDSRSFYDRDSHVTLSSNVRLSLVASLVGRRGGREDRVGFPSPSLGGFGFIGLAMSLRFLRGSRHECPLL